MTYAKCVLAIIASGLSAAIVALTDDGVFNNVEKINVAIAVVSAVGVFYVPNAVNAKVAKAVVAVLMAILTLAVQLIAGGFTLSEWLQLAMAGLAALGVYGIANSPSSTPAHLA